MKSLTTAAALVVSSVLATGTLAAQSTGPTPPMKEETPGLLAQATITPDAARKSALAQVANGRIAEQEIEMENGKLAYSFDIKVARRSGVEEVLIDAKNGALIVREHEGPQAQAAERAKERRISSAANSRANTKTGTHLAKPEAREPQAKRPAGSR